MGKNKRIQPLSTLKEADIPVTLINEIRKNNVFMLVGSGLSIPLGFPSWENLITKLYDRIKSNHWKQDIKTKKWLKDNFNSVPDWTAELLKSISGDFYTKALSEIFKSYPENPVSIAHALISLIPFKGYITTNYDTLIEDYLSIFMYNEPSIFSHIDLMNNRRLYNFNKLSVFKIHGCIKKNPHELVLSSSDYYKLLHDQKYIRFIDFLFSQNIVFSIGFSLRDRDFRTFVEERYNLYGAKCAPMYSIVEEHETCPLEIDLYLNKYNIHIVPISKDNNFSELSSLLLSLYCLVYKVDSNKFGSHIISLVLNRLAQTGKFNNISLMPENHSIQKVKRLLSIFKEPVDIELFTTICTDAKIELSPAHYKAISTISENKIYLKTKVEPDNKDIEFVSSWLSNYFESIPSGTSSRYLSIYHKRILKEFSKTIFYLLTTKTGWTILIGTDNLSTSRLTRFNEFYRQEGKWKEWLILIENVETFIDKKSQQYLNLMKTKVWVYFWTRRYHEANELITRFPMIDEKEGQYSYSARLQYMNNDYLNNLIKVLSNQTSLDYFNRSLLGRSYARQSLKSKNVEEKKILLEKAKDNLTKALDEAKLKNDMIEISVQSWYLAIVYAELNDLKNANFYLADVKRIDESIMNRIPGIAWLKLAEYRLAFNNDSIDKLEKDNLRDIAIEYMNRLGMSKVEEYVDCEYFY